MEISAIDNNRICTLYDNVSKKLASHCTHRRRFCPRRHCRRYCCRHHRRRPRRHRCSMYLCFVLQLLWTNYLLEVLELLGAGNHVLVVLAAERGELHLDAAEHGAQVRARLCLLLQAAVHAVEIVLQRRQLDVELVALLKQTGRQE